jgi:hypothetical protein
MACVGPGCWQRHFVVLYYRDEDIDPMRRHGQQHEIANADITGVTNDSAEPLDDGAMIGTSGTRA